MRHRWTKTDEVDRDKRCQVCDMQARRFGIGRHSYWEYTRNGIVINEGGPMPPCTAQP